MMISSSLYLLFWVFCSFIFVFSWYCTVWKQLLLNMQDKITAFITAMKHLHLHHLHLASIYIGKKSHFISKSTILPLRWLFCDCLIIIHGKKISCFSRTIISQYMRAHKSSVLSVSSVFCIVLHSKLSTDTQGFLVQLMNKQKDPDGKKTKNLLLSQVH